MARTVNIALIPAGSHRVEFYPDLASLGDDTLLLEKRYSVTTAVNGIGSISLPTKVSGTIGWTVYLPKSGGGRTEATFYLGPGAAINLEDAIAAGTEPTSTVTDYVDAQELGDHADVVITSPADGETLLYDDATGNWVNGPAGNIASDLTADQSVDVSYTNQTVLQDTELSVTVEAGRYLFRIGFQITPGGGTVSVGFGGTAPVTSCKGGFHSARGGGSIGGRFDDVADLMTLGTASAPDFGGTIHGVVEFSGPGTFLLKAAQLTSSSTPGIFYSGSNLRMIKLGGGGGGGGGETLTTFGALVNSATAKATPVDADQLPLMDSAAANITKKLSWANLKATLKTYFDTLYVAVTGNQTVAGIKTFSSSPIVPTPATDFQASTKKYVDDSIIAGGGYTDEQAQDAVGAMVDGTLTYTDATPLLKVADGGVNTTQLANDAVTNAKAANMEANTVKGRITGSTGDPEDLTASNIRTIINVADGATANDTDANLRARANHTGTQTASTISDFNAAALAAAPAETASTLGATVNGSSAATPNNTDLVATVESSVVKKITWTNVKAFLKTYFDTLYPSGSGTSSGTNTGDQTSIAGITGTLAQFNTAITDGNIIPEAGGTFTGDISVPAEAYNATNWNGSNEVPTKNDTRDEIEALRALIGGGGYSDEAAQDAIGAMTIDTDTINATYTDATPELKFDARVQMSITSDSSGLKLSGDEASPGSNEYYGTNGAGTKGYHPLTVSQTEAGTTKSLAAADDGLETRYSSASAKTLTVTVTATAGTGHVSKHTNLGAGALSIVPDTGVTLRNDIANIPQYGSALVVAIGTDEYMIVPTITNDALTRSSLGLAIGTNVQAWSANLDEYAAVNPTAAGLALLDDATAGDQRTTLGLGTIATQNANNVTISGGAVTGITDIAVADGGTGASTAAAARTNLGVDAFTAVWVIDGGGSAITTGVKGYLRIPHACTVTGWRLLADVAGSIVIDVWKDTYANYPPVVADTIAGSEKPTLSSVIKNEDTSLSTWTTAISAGDILGFNVDSAATVTRVTLELLCTRT